MTPAVPLSEDLLPTLPLRRPDFAMHLQKFTESVKREIFGGPTVHVWSKSGSNGG